MVPKETLVVYHYHRPLALRGDVTNASFKTMSYNLADAKH